MSIPISAEGVAELCAYGWLDIRKCRNAITVAEAVSGLCDEALSARLRPR